MLETIDLSQKLDKETFGQWFPQLQENLRLLQREAYEAGMPTIIVLEGWDAAGKGDAVMKLVERLDPRGFKIDPPAPPGIEEQMRPFLWRFWIKLPSDGQIAIFDRSWYGRVLVERMDGLIAQRQWQQAYQEIAQFERQLTDDGHVLVKFFLHISKKEQRKRFKQMEKDPAESWKVSKEDWKHHKQYEEYQRVVEEMLERTSTSNAPWTIVESTDRRFRRVKIFQTIVKAMREGLDRKRQYDARKAEERAKFERDRAERDKARERAAKAASPEAAVVSSEPASAPALDQSDETPAPVFQEMPSILDKTDLSARIERQDYDKELPDLQVRMRELEFACFNNRLPVIVAYEGWDAGGKGGNIKRVTQTLDPRGYNVIPISAPKGDEATHHYLWRFWRHVPKAGHITLFDRTWYGRILVERVEGFCMKEEWQRAFQEINEFEQSLVNWGAVIVKFWIHIGKEEQLRRFEERQETSYKQYKITDEDWRNRGKWDDYKLAVTEAIERTSTSYAPWTIIEGEDKLWARIKALRTIVAAVEAALEAKGNGKKGRKK